MAVRNMNPAALRAAILAAELLVFFAVTAFMTYFISYAGALHPEPGDAPPAHFPVIAYDGDRKRPEPKGYRVMPWSEWERTAQQRPGASLLLPERNARMPIGETEVSFTVTADNESRQSVDLTWRTPGGEQQVRYDAQARSIEPRYYRAVSSDTFLIAAGAGFIAGLFVGRVLRRRWLAQPGYFVTTSSQGKN
ncbi:MAG TPA: hypothetical protein VFO57_08430 [Burkholderiales bacterium]|nr:hypothetical protein [Burkholderiales bacterium]